MYFWLKAGSDTNESPALVSMPPGPPGVLKSLSERELEVVFSIMVSVAFTSEDPTIPANIVAAKMQDFNLCVIMIPTFQFPPFYPVLSRLGRNSDYIAIHPPGFISISGRFCVILEMYGHKSEYDDK